MDAERPIVLLFRVSALFSCLLENGGAQRRKNEDFCFLCAQNSVHREAPAKPPRGSNWINCHKLTALQAPAHLSALSTKERSKKKVLEPPWGQCGIFDQLKKSCLWTYKKKKYERYELCGVTFQMDAESIHLESQHFQTSVRTWSKFDRSLTRRLETVPNLLRE
jgi:hypothetical protein